MSFDEQIEKLVDEKVAKALPGAIAKALDNIKPTEANPDDQNIIRGFDELAKFLNVSKATAIKLKKNRVFPYYQWGRVMFFKPDEVLAGMRKEAK